MNYLDSTKDLSMVDPIEMNLKLLTLMHEYPPTRKPTEEESKQWIRLARKGSVRRAYLWWLAKFGPDGSEK